MAGHGHVVVVAERFLQLGEQTGVTLGRFVTAEQLQEEIGHIAQLLGGETQLVQLLRREAIEVTPVFQELAVLAGEHPAGKHAGPPGKDAQAFGRHIGAPSALLDPGTEGQLEPAAPRVGHRGARLAIGGSPAGLGGRLEKIEAADR